MAKYPDGQEVMVGDRVQNETWNCEVIFVLDTGQFTERHTREEWGDLPDLGGNTVGLLVKGIEDPVVTKPDEGWILVSRAPSR